MHISVKFFQKCKIRARNPRMRHIANDNNLFPINFAEMFLHCVKIKQSLRGMGVFAVTCVHKTHGISDFAADFVDNSVFAMAENKNVNANEIKVFKCIFH